MKTEHELQELRPICYHEPISVLIAKQEFCIFNKLKWIPKGVKQVRKPLIVLTLPIWYQLMLNNVVLGKNDRTPVIHQLIEEKKIGNITSIFIDDSPTADTKKVTIVYECTWYPGVRLLNIIL